MQCMPVGTKSNSYLPSALFAFGVICFAIFVHFVHVIMPTAILASRY